MVEVCRFELGGFVFRAVPNGLPGRLGTLLSPRGGWGKELMLTDFRSVFVPATAADTARGCGSAAEGAGVFGGGNKVEEGARRPLLGVPVNDLAGDAGGGIPDVLRVLATGSAGRAMVGGPLEGLEGVGSAVVILRTWKGYLMAAFLVVMTDCGGVYSSFAVNERNRTAESWSLRHNLL